ncbi:serine/threonine-protein kinase [Nocardia sp. NPDC003482]
MPDIGASFAGYRIERVLGRGGMGTVYLARHPRLPRSVALKVLNRELFTDNDIRARFEREAELVARLDHPGIVAVHDRGIDGDQQWIAMQYVEGITAAALDPARLAPEHAVRIVGYVAQALDYAHGHGILHRDVKPANILLARPGQRDERILLTDFGIARLLDETRHLTRTGTVNGTLGYASPEQLTGVASTARSDQYSLACTLFRLLTGRSPFESPNAAAVVKGHLQHSPPAVSASRAGVPPAMDAVLARALAKHPDDRFASCTEFATAAWYALTQNDFRLAPAATQPRPAPVLAPAPDSPPPALPASANEGRSRWRKVVVPTAIAVLVAAGAGVGVTASVLSNSSGAAPVAARPTRTPDPEQERQGEEYVAALRAASIAFPKMVPAERTVGTTRSGYGHSSCEGVPGFRAFDPEFDTIDFKTYIGAWQCLGAEVVTFSIYAYRSPDDVRAVVAGLPPHTRTVEVNNGVAYTNYEFWHDARSIYQKPFVSRVTTFLDDPDRATFLLIARPMSSADGAAERLHAWWSTAPIG